MIHLANSDILISTEGLRLVKKIKRKNRGEDMVYYIHLEYGDGRNYAIAYKHEDQSDHPRYRRDADFGQIGRAVRT